MRVVFFLLDTFFFFLVAAALLRAWMNHQRIHMSAQPGRLVIAVTDWLVAPVRRILPRSLAQSRMDWGSLMAAVLFALAYGGLWLMLAATLTPVEASPAAMMLARVGVKTHLMPEVTVPMPASISWMERMTAAKPGESRWNSAMRASKFRSSFPVRLSQAAFASWKREVA